MRSAIRVLVVDDSALVRQMLCRALSAAPGIEVVGTAGTGFEAISKALELQPDVITLDIQMPELSGLEALAQIVRNTPARVVMLTAVEDPDTAYEALDLGATDFVVKPRKGLASSLAEAAEVLVRKIEIASRVPPERRLIRRAEGAGSPKPVRSPRQSAPRGFEKVVAIAASTGGPPALEVVFSALNTDLPAAYVIVQHLPAGFADPLARRLSRTTDIAVSVPSTGTVLQQGMAYLAPHGTHMRVEGRTVPRLQLESSPPLHSVRPAADPLFESVAARFGDKAVGVVLTGMGVDGATGMMAIRNAGGTTIVQDEETSVVWGMPGAAVRAGAAAEVVPLSAVAGRIRRAVGA